MSGEGYISPTTGYLIGTGNSAQRTSGNVGIGSVGFTITAAGSTVCEVLISVLDAAGAVIAGVFEMTVNLSDAATGAGLTGTAASGTVAAKSASGVDLAVFVAKKATRVQTLGTGKYTLEITASAKTGYYIAVTGPNGRTYVSRQLVTADYGA